MADNRAIAEAVVPLVGGAENVVIATNCMTRLRLTLKDKDKGARDAKVILSALDLNKGNKQVAHGIDRVLRPIDL